MAGSETWAGWIRLGAIFILIVSFLEFFEGLTAIIRGDYYHVTPDQIVVFDLSTWGWLTLLWSIALAVIGFALLAGATWPRRAAIVVAGAHLFAQLGPLRGARDARCRPPRPDSQWGGGRRGEQGEGRNGHRSPSPTVWLPVTAGRLLDAA